MKNSVKNLPCRSLLPFTWQRIVNKASEHNGLTFSIILPNVSSYCLQCLCWSSTYEYIWVGMWTCKIDEICIDVLIKLEIGDVHSNSYLLIQKIQNLIGCWFGFFGSLGCSAVCCCWRPKPARRNHVEHLTTQTCTCYASTYNNNAVWWLV